jgi:hypothetical protein
MIKMYKIYSFVVHLLKLCDIFIKEPEVLCNLL